MSQRTAYFDEISVSSVWYALVYAVRGWRVLYFDQTRMGRALASAFARLSRNRISFSATQYYLGDYKGLYRENTRLALEITQEWARQADSELTRGWFDFGEQPRRVEAYIKKSTLMSLITLVLKVLIFERLSARSGEEARFVTGGSGSTRWRLRQFRRITGRSPKVVFRLSLPAWLAVVASLVRYYASMCLFIMRRGVSFHRVQEDYLLANQASWPIGRQRADDFLVDGETILPSDLLIYYNSASTKLEPIEAADAARKAGYRTVAWDRVPARLGWLTSRSTITTYLLGPMLQGLRSILPGAGKHSGNVVRLLLSLRRQMLGWDVFFERYNVGCLIADSIGPESQAAETMSIHKRGGITAGIQATENSDEFNKYLYYLTYHYLFTWGQGVAGPWRETWCVDQVVPVGYLWGHFHQQSLDRRQSIRARYGVNSDSALIAVFDSSAGPKCRASLSCRHRFYGAVTTLVDTLKTATAVIKPKGLGIPVSHLVPHRDGPSGPRVILEDSAYTNTNELIAAADLVISLGHSSTTIESLVCGVPAVAYDETGRDWRAEMGRPDVLVFDNAADLCRAAVRILQEGIDPQTWEEIQDRIQQNFGGVDSQAITRIRAHILEACGAGMPSTRTPVRSA